MGAAVGKAAADFDGAAARLAFAEHTMLQWNRSPDADSGIWDADGNFTKKGKGLLAAVDEVLLLAEEEPLPAVESSARRQLDSAVAVAMSRMVEEFVRVRVWNATQLRFAVNRLALGASGASAMACFPGAGGRGSTTSSSDRSSTTSTGDEGSTATTGRAAALMDDELLDKIDLICPAGVSVFHEIAQRVIRAGGTVEFLQAFANAPCDVLDSLLSILGVKCSRHIAGIFIKRWSTVTKLLENAIVAMQKQLYARNLGAFHDFRDEYLMAIAQSRIFALLQSAEEFARNTSHEKLPYILSMYEALSDAAPSLLLLYSGGGERKALVSERIQGTLTKLADVAKIMTSGLMAKVQSAAPPLIRPRASGGVHPLTRYVVRRVEQLLSPHRTAPCSASSSRRVVTSMAPSSA
ncbi:hypothetical protein QOZ80_1BG0093490 [Eleusine coracana subsp. coracana]|nr:hypothetical protein QOZ80_1BG0093490 [Eleusine coracana subsp. coracana]